MEYLIISVIWKFVQYTTVIWGPLSGCFLGIKEDIQIEASNKRDLFIPDDEASAENKEGIDVHIDQSIHNAVGMQCVVIITADDSYRSGSLTPIFFYR